MSTATARDRTRATPTPTPAPALRPARAAVAERRRRRRTSAQRQWRLALSITVTLTVIAIFGAAIFHVLLVQSEFRLEKIQNQAVAEQQRYEQLRLEVARLGAPERIVAEAQKRLGMVVPAHVEYLVAPAQPADDPASGPLASGWSKVKPHLGPRR
ncbi:MAG: hypothetical protein ACRDY7_07110 [Acidimicrobiia bacterium]